MNSGKATVAIFSHNQIPSSLEIVSLRQCLDVLSHHKICLIIPDDLNPDAYLKIAPSLDTLSLPAIHFKSLETYNKLKLSRLLYDSLCEYDSLLTYELDSFVFRDDLDYWTRQNIDYIGAPWFEGYSQANVNSPMIAVGNSGFSLRRIHSCIAVIVRLERLKRLRTIASSLDSFTLLDVFDRVINKLYGKFVTHAVQGRHVQEDFFWSFGAARLLPKFKVASLSQAKEFSFEVNARRLYQELDRLPFGCHAWHKYDTDFWSQHIPFPSPLDTPINP
jgi:hypothetical protein